jgi:hypothetical protein
MSIDPLTILQQYYKNFAKLVKTSFDKNFHNFTKFFVVLLKSHSQYLSSMLIIENQTKTTIFNRKKNKNVNLK